MSKFRLTGGCQSQRCNRHFYAVNPKNKDCYYMRLLLHEVRGPTSYQDLRVVDGVKKPSYKAACRVCGVLNDGEHWHRTLEEAAASQLSKKLNSLFAIMSVNY